MLGRFLEFSVATPDIAASFDFYTRLGWAQVPVGDAWPHPYAVLTDGRLHIGLHAAELDTPQLTFVRPMLLQAVDPLEQLGIAFDVRRLGSDQFNELGWHDPGGHRLRLLEARTFSPVQRATSPSLCGDFLEVALPAAEVDAAKLWWERLGFVGLDEQEGRLDHVCCMSDTLNVGLYAPQVLATPTLVFEVGALAPLRTRLASLGIDPARTLPRGLSADDALRLVAPEGTPLLIYPAPG